MSDVYSPIYNGESTTAIGQNEFKADLIAIAKMSACLLAYGMFLGAVVVIGLSF